MKAAPVLGALESRILGTSQLRDLRYQSTEGSECREIAPQGIQLPEWQLKLWRAADPYSTVVQANVSHMSSHHGKVRRDKKIAVESVESTFKALR
jgi:hypothetical protein